MKNAFILAITGLLFFYSKDTLAQKGLNFGLKGSYILNKINGYYLPNSRVFERSDFKVRFGNGNGHGLVIRYGFNDKFGIVTGMSWVTHKPEIVLHAPWLSISARRGQKMIEIPFAVNFRKVMGVNRKTSFSIFSGPTIVFWDSHDNITSGTYLLSDSANTNTYIDVFFQQDEFAVGLRSGVGFEKSFNEYGSLYAGIAYNHIFSHPLRFAGEYNIGNRQYDIEFYLRGSYLSVDLIYYLNWFAFSGKNKSKAKDVVSVSY